MKRAQVKNFSVKGVEAQIYKVWRSVTQRQQAVI